MEIHCHVSEASEGLEKTRIKNRGGLKGKHYPYAHEANAHKITSINQTRLTNGLTIAKVLDYTIYMGEYYYYLVVI